MTHKAFLQKASSLSPEQVVREYLEICDDLMLGDENEVREIIRVMTGNIRDFAYRNSKFYSSDRGIIDKSMLSDKLQWFVDGVDYIDKATNGTTGNRFYYRAWKDTFDRIERDFHYGAILKEYEIQKPKVLCLLGQHVHPASQDVHNVVVLKDTSSPMHSHGASNAEVHSVDVSMAWNDPDASFKQLFDYIRSQNFDVILSSGPFINSMVHYVQKFGIKGKLCKLLSNTCEPLMLLDVAALKNNGLIDYWCDHMRCWDGGASFFTCKHGVYHLMDNLSYCYTSNDRLISTDYFSLASPFIDYWNGDLAQVENKYRRCPCGRLYRPFCFLSPRDFSHVGITSSEIKSRIKSTGVKGIKYVKIHHRFAEITTKRQFSWDEQEVIKKSLPEIPHILFHAEIPCSCGSNGG
jgi:hypothetical protein